MELKELYAKCAELTELLRDGQKRDCQKEYEAVVTEYKRVWNVISHERKSRKI